MGACQCEASKTRLVPFGFTYGTELGISRGSRDRVRVGGQQSRRKRLTVPTHRVHRDVKKVAEYESLPIHEELSSQVGPEGRAYLTKTN